MSTLAKAIAGIDPATSKGDEMKTALGLISDLANSKTQQFRAEISESIRTAGGEENKTVPVDAILAHSFDTRGYVSDSAKDIVDQTIQAIKGFVSSGSDNIINGIGSLLSTGLTALLGAGVGSEMERSDYFIAVEGLSIVRIDVKSWCRRIEAKGITTKIEKMSSICAVKSSVNVKEISFNTFLYAYSHQLSKLPKEQLIAEITEAKKVFEALRGEVLKDIRITEEFLRNLRPDNGMADTDLPGYWVQTPERAVKSVKIIR